MNYFNPTVIHGVGFAERGGEKVLLRSIANAIAFSDSMRTILKTGVNENANIMRYLVYGQNDKGSVEAAEKLVDLGYTNAVEFGGMAHWPWELVSGDE